MIGVMTEDFALYHDVLSFLRRCGVPFVSLSPRRTIPRRVSVVLTSEAEASSIRFPNVVAVRSLHGSLVAARRMERGARADSRLIVGVDPGERIGFAVLSGGEVILSGRTHTPEGLAEVVSAVAAGEPGTLLVKVGHGAPTIRNRILASLVPVGVETLVVDETETSKRSRRGLDEDAAARIASLEGAHLEGPFSAEPTAGEVRDIQRRSRIASRGEVTIDRELARGVAVGEFTLEQAVERARRSPKK